MNYIPKNLIPSIKMCRPRLFSPFLRPPAGKPPGVQKTEQTAENRPRGDEQTEQYFSVPLFRGGKSFHSGCEEAQGRHIVISLVKTGPSCFFTSCDPSVRKPPGVQKQEKTAENRPRGDEQTEQYFSVPLFRGEKSFRSGCEETRGRHIVISLVKTGPSCFFTSCGPRRGGRPAGRGPSGGRQAERCGADRTILFDTPFSG